MEVAFSQELWAITRLCLRTGARPFEARALCGGDVNADKWWARLQHKKGTGDVRQREVPITCDATIGDLVERRCVDLYQPGGTVR